MGSTLVALYRDFETARRALEALIEEGLSRDAISVVANDAEGYTERSAETDVTPGEGAGFGAVVGTLIGLGAMAIPGIGPVIAAGPAAALIGAAIGAAGGAVAGGIVAGLVDSGIPEGEADFYAEGVRRGGALVTASVEDVDVARVASVLENHNPIDIDNHLNNWRQGGWTGFDNAAAPLSPEQINQERAAVQGYSNTDDVTQTSRPVGMYRGQRYEAYAPQFQEHHISSYGTTDHDYAYYLPAYRFGYTLAADERYSSHDWDKLEPEARRRWELRHEGSWNEFKDAVQHAWENVKRNDRRSLTE